MVCGLGMVSNVWFVWVLVSFVMVSVKFVLCKLLMVFLFLVFCVENRESKECVVIVMFEVFFGLVSVDVVGVVVGREWFWLVNFDLYCVVDCIWELLRCV